MLDDQMNEARNVLEAEESHGVKFVACHPVREPGSHRVSTPKTEAGWDSWVSLRERLNAEPAFKAAFLEVIQADRPWPGV